MTPIKNKVTDDDLADDDANARALSAENDPASHLKPLIPGLPESERLKKKSRKKKTKNNSEATPPLCNLRAADFLSSPSIAPGKSSDISEEFVFSEYDDDDTDSGNEKFEDSLEHMNDSKHSDVNHGGALLSALKRSARSPADQKDN